MDVEEARQKNAEYEAYRRWYREECMRQGLLPDPYKKEETDK